MFALWNRNRLRQYCKAVEINKKPPCRRREVGGEGRGAFGFVIGGLVYPLEVVYVQSVVFTPAEKCTIAIRGTRYHDVVGF